MALASLTENLQIRISKRMNESLALLAAHYSEKTNSKIAPSKIARGALWLFLTEPGMHRFLPGSVEDKRFMEILENIDWLDNGVKAYDVADSPSED
jgi:hypothetical protein